MVWLPHEEHVEVVGSKGKEEQGEPLVGAIEQDLRGEEGIRGQGWATVNCIIIIVPSIRGLSPPDTHPLPAPPLPSHRRDDHDRLYTHAEDLNA